MKAAVLSEVNQPLEIEDVQHGNPGPREVLVRTAPAGVCHSDPHFHASSRRRSSRQRSSHPSPGRAATVRSRYRRSMFPYWPAR